MDDIRRVTFELKSPIKGRFQVVRINSPEFGVWYNARHRGRVYQGGSPGEAMGRLFNSLDWPNLLKVNRG